MNKKIIILIPAYEPTSEFINLLRKLKENNLKTIVVNDGSNSRYDEIFKIASKYATILKHDINKGKGQAIKTGIKYIQDTNKNKYIIVTMDCDGQHTLEDALKLGNYAKEHENELVLGKRLRDKNVPLRSRLGNNITRYIYKLITNLDVYDTQTGLRAFSNELILLMLEIEGDRFEYEMNVLLNCTKKKIKITELEISTIYIDNNSNSHFHPIKDSLKIYKELFKYINKK